LTPGYHGNALSASKPDEGVDNLSFEKWIESDQQQEILFAKGSYKRLGRLMPIKYMNGEAFLYKSAL